MAAQQLDDIDRLNAKVSSIMEDITSGKLKAAQNPLAGNPEAVEAVRNGAIVYHRRSKLVLAGLMSLIAYALATQKSPIYVVACLAIMMIAMDFQVRPVLWFVGIVTAPSRASFGVCVCVCVCVRACM